MTRLTYEPLRTFCSYAHRDERYLNVLRTWLRPLERKGLIQWWHDREIVPGWEWEEAIDMHLRTADIILLLVSPDFMGSDYVYEKEIDRAIKRQEQGEARIIPIIVRPTYWEGSPLDKLQVLPRDAKPITTWSNRDKAWLDVIRGVRRAVAELAGKSRERERQAAISPESQWRPQPSQQIGDTAERRSLLDNLYAQARQLHQAQDWQAVIDVFDKQIFMLDPDYPDPEELLVSAREALVTSGLARTVAGIYDQGLQHMYAEDWPKALQCFEEIQHLEPGYRQTETLMARMRHQLANREKARSGRDTVSFRSIKPGEILYTVSHEWVRSEGEDTATVGITNYAQDELGDIVFVELPEEGDTFDAGDSFGTVESVKAVSDLYTPVGGEVVEVNSALEDAPEQINEDPYGEGWIVKLRTSDEADLLSPEEYEKIVEEES